MEVDRDVGEVDFGKVGLGERLTCSTTEAIVRTNIINIPLCIDKKSLLHSNRQKMITHTQRLALRYSVAEFTL